MTASPRLAARVVWGAWILLSAATLFLVASCARNVPYWDDWKLVPVLLRLQPPSLAWIWDQCNEHRLPLSKALMLALARLSGDDLRGAMVGSAVLLCALPAVMLLTLRRLAGGLSWTDLVLPVALLNWGHQFNLLFQLQLHFVLAIVLFVGVLMVLLRLVEPAPPADAPANGPGTWPLFAVALPLPWVSGLGLCLTPVLVMWMVWAAERAPRPSLRRALRLCAALSTVWVTVLLFNLPSSPASGPGFVGLGDTLATAQRCLSTALGPVGRELWPWSGLYVTLVGLATVVLLVRVMLREPERRLGASVLLAGLLSLGGLALVIGASRAGLGWEAGFAPRYVTVMAPGLCLAHLAWRLHGRGLGRRGVPALLCVTLVLALPFNAWLGLRDAQQHAAELGALEADVRAGMPDVDVARIHWPRVCPSEVVLGEDLEMLRLRRRWLFQPGG
ncbi:MAG TPA: hypothetical protein VFY71_11770 [Planctomycetota bacterium]|nr:hypothetical protein [Planctomycetota bacterium]